MKVPRPKLGMIVPIVGMLPILLGAIPANAQAFKCVEQGRTVYQGQPCAGGTAVDTRGSSGVTGLKQDAERYAAQQDADAKAQQVEAAAKEATEKKRILDNARKSFEGPFPFSKK